MTEKKKKLKSLIRFYSVIKIDKYNRRAKEKKSKIIYRTSQNKSNKCFSWVIAVRVLSLAGSHSPPHLPRMPSNTGLVSGPAVEAAQTNLVLLLCGLSPAYTTVRTSAFSFMETHIVL